ncbi:MAG: hypothetical protein ACRC20_16045 [Segniliparus sp.]|uniref:hypothetical protein n=1 Tax=Segniliparus sp. TaxID=2804064 RepID=UPI003F3A256C
MGPSRIFAVVGLCAATLAAPAPLAPAAPAGASCPAVGAIDDLLGDIRFDLGNLRGVLDNVYASPDVKKHDEDFRLNLLVNAVGRLKDAAGQSGSGEARRAAAEVEAGFEALKSAVHDQFVVLQDEHYDFYSSIHYRSPRLAGGTPAAPEAYDAIDALDDQRQAFADLADGLRARLGCAAPRDDEDRPDGTGPDETGPDGTAPQCRFHPGSYQCDATGSIEH